MTPDAALDDRDDEPGGRVGVLLLLAVGSIGMVALGTFEVWGERAHDHIGFDSGLLLLPLGAAPVGVMIAVLLLVHRRLLTRGTPALAVGGRAARAAATGWALLLVGAVLLLQAVLFGASSALVQEIGCGDDSDDWCGFASGIFGAIALTLAGAAAVVGALLVAVTRRTAAACPDRVVVVPRPGR